MTTERPHPQPVSMVYVHFPYCLEKCPYCDFVSYRVARPEVPHEAYADAVLVELDRRAARLADAGHVAPVESVFFGGGTPSLWRPEQLGRVLAGIVGRLGRAPNLEVTVECNPTSLDRAHAEALRGVGVDRVSIGVQSLDERRLAFLGRLHDPAGALAAIDAALAAGVPRVSADLIYGVAGQRPDEAASEAARLADAGLAHVSAYNLTIEAGTRFGELARKGRLPLADEGAMVDSFHAVSEALSSRGLAHYEISNHAAPGHESRHNLGYWRGAPYLGLGCAAFGTVPDGPEVVRYRNQPLPARYIAAVRDGALVDEGELVTSCETLSADDRLRERIMLGLRLAEGLDLAAAAREVGAAPWPPARVRAAERLVQRGRLVRDGDRLAVPRDAWVFADGTSADLF